MAKPRPVRLKCFLSCGVATCTVAIIAMKENEDSIADTIR
jgi:hypothetical protein